MAVTSIVTSFKNKIDNRNCTLGSITVGIQTGVEALSQYLTITCRARQES